MLPGPDSFKYQLWYISLLCNFGEIYSSYLGLSFLSHKMGIMLLTQLS